MKKIKKRLLFSCILSIIVIFIAFFVITIIRESYYNVDIMDKATLNSIKNSKTNKLMIVAHPDDETIWGGAHLLEGGYFVICITRGYDEERSAEFCKVLKDSGNEGIILNYPDKVLGKRDDWDRVDGKIKKDIKNVLKLKNWEMIVTHNKDGEYGHRHHIMLNKMVRLEAEKTSKSNSLFYFGKYYSKKELATKDIKLTRIEKENLIKKEELLKNYASQKSTIKKLEHMLPYEKFQKEIAISSK
jgi:LmbE family N-acetylglucosaminyl deacetylase